MASSLPAGALGNLAASIKNIVSQPTEDAAGPTTTQNATPAATKDVAAADIKVSHADGKTIHKEKAAAVEHETVKTREHEKVDTVVDKEVHQDHYHRTVVPVKDKNVLPTKHTYKENEEEREFDHRDDTAATKAKQEGEQFKNEKEIEATKHTKQVAPTQQNETVHQ